MYQRKVNELEPVDDSGFDRATDIANRFKFHPATDDEKRNAHTAVRVHCRSLADYINDALPDGDEKDKAIDYVELAMFYANASLARNNMEVTNG